MFVMSSFTGGPGLLEAVNITKNFFVFSSIDDSFQKGRYFKLEINKGKKKIQRQHCQQNFQLK